MKQYSYTEPISSFLDSHFDNLHAEASKKLILVVFSSLHRNRKSSKKGSHQIQNGNQKTASRHPWNPIEQQTRIYRSTMIDLETSNAKHRTPKRKTMRSRSETWHGTHLCNLGGFRRLNQRRGRRISYPVVQSKVGLCSEQRQQRRFFRICERVHDSVWMIPEVITAPIQVGALLVIVRGVTI